MTSCGVSRTDPARTQYTGALCGLGWDENTGGPALPDHDIEIAFDVKFDVEDLSMVSARPGHLTAVTSPCTQTQARASCHKKHLCTTFVAHTLLPIGM